MKVQCLAEECWATYVRVSSSTYRERCVVKHILYTTPFFSPFAAFFLRLQHTTVTVMMIPVSSRMRMMAEMITAGEYTVENTTQSVTAKLYCSFLSSNPHGSTDGLAFIQYCSLKYSEYLRLQYKPHWSFSHKFTGRLCVVFEPCNTVTRMLCEQNHLQLNVTKTKDCGLWEDQETCDLLQSRRWMWTSWRSINASEYTQKTPGLG